MNFDDVLKSIGEFGPYQRFIYFLLCVPLIAMGLHKFVWVFLIMQPKFRCQLIFDQMANVSTLPYELPGELMNKSIPYDSHKMQYKDCKQYKIHVESTPIFSNWTVFDEEMRFTRDEESCSAYVFDTSDYESTLVSEFNLVCSHAWEQANGQALYVVGELLASLVSGYLGDRYGRRKVIMAGVFGHIIFGSLCAVSPSHFFLILFRFLMGFSALCMYLSSFVIVMEFIGPSLRMEASNGTHNFFSLGYILVLPFAYFIRNWRYLQFAVTVPAYGMLALWWLLPESPRWLMANNKFEDSKAVLQKVASSNNLELPKDLKIEDFEYDLQAEESYSLISLFKYPKMRIRIFISCYLWFVSSGGYFGLALNSSNIGGNVYINFLIAAALDFPANFFTTYLVRYFGRVWTLCAMYLITGLALIATSAVPQDQTTLMITLAMIGKFAVTITFNGVYLYAGEVFPTVVRNTALGMCSTFASIGAISAPYIALLDTYWRPAPLVIFGAESLLAAALSLILPETKNKTLPETIIDGEVFGAKETKVKNATPNTHLNSAEPTVQKYDNNEVI